MNVNVCYGVARLVGSDFSFQYLQLPTSVQFEENRVYDLTTALSQEDTAQSQFPEIDRQHSRRRSQ